MDKGRSRVAVGDKSCKIHNYINSAFGSCRITRRYNRLRARAFSPPRGLQNSYSCGSRRGCCYADKLDMSRMPAQVVSGIGFLGAGTILREGFSVKGLTTAASLWAVSCVGLAVGSGFFVGALVATFVIYLTLNSLKKVVARGHAGKALYIEVKDLADEVPQLSKIIRRSGAVIHSMEILYDSDSKLRKKKNTSTIKALIFPKSDESLNMIISTIRADENVVDIYVD